MRSRNFGGRFESLESRQMLTSGLVLDLNATGERIRTTRIAAFNDGVLTRVPTTMTHAIWRVDGSADEGTFLSESYDVKFGPQIGDIMYFTSDDKELWRGFSGDVGELWCSGRELCRGGFRRRRRSWVWGLFKARREFRSYPQAGRIVGVKEATRNEQRATSNEQRATSNEQRATRNEKRATSNEQRATSNEQRATSNEQRATSNEQRATSNEQRATSNEQRETRNEKRATSNEQRATSNEQRATSNEQRATSNEQRETRNEKRETRNEKRETRPANCLSSTTSVRCGVTQRRWSARRVH